MGKLMEGSTASREAKLLHPLNRLEPGWIGNFFQELKTCMSTAILLKKIRLDIL
jgi:hypothetical protein